MFYGALFRLHSMMTKWHFNSILATLAHVHRCPLSIVKDKIHEVQQLIVSFKDRMTKVFNPACWAGVLFG